jgi:hypothetical protein
LAIRGFLVTWDGSSRPKGGSPFQQPGPTRAPPQGNWKAAVVAITVVAIVMVAAMFLEANLREDGTHPRELSEQWWVSYTFGMSMNGTTEVLVPYSDCGPVRESMEVTHGVGDFDFVETPYGPAMRVRADSHMTIKGLWEAERPFSQADMARTTINLTTREPGFEMQDEELHGFNDQVVWVNWTSGPLTRLAFVSEMCCGTVLYHYERSMAVEWEKPGWYNVSLEGGILLFGN